MVQLISETRDEAAAAKRIAADLANLGLCEHDTVLVRSATRFMTVPTRSRPGALLDGIRKVVGPRGTIVALAFTPDFYPWQRKRAAAVPFHRDAKSETGALPQILVSNPDAVRSMHPTNSFVAVGPNARSLLEGHGEKATAFYPIERLIELGGKLALIGCVRSSPGFSTVHRAQEALGLADRSLLSNLRICAVRDGDVIRFFSRKDVSGCSEGFWKFYEKYEQEGILHKGTVGGAPSILANAAAAYRIEREILAQDPTFAFCDDPACTSCGLRTYSPARMARFFVSVPQKIARGIFGGRR